MTTLKDCITITIKHLAGVAAGEASSSETEVGRRSAFWKPIMPVQTAGIPPKDPAAMEQIFNRDFGSHMRGAMLDAMMLGAQERTIAIVPAAGDDARIELMRVTFQARVTGYGSLEAALTIGGVEYLARFFSDNFESCMIFLEGLILPSLQRTYGCNVQMNESVRFELHPSEALAAYFVSQPGETATTLAPPTVASTIPLSPTITSATTQPSNPQMTPMVSSPSRVIDKGLEQAQRLALLINGSFLVPVVLALLVCYIALVQMNEVRARQDAMMTNLLTYQSKMLEEDRARLILVPPGAIVTPPPTP